MPGIQTKARGLCCFSTGNNFGEFRLHGLKLQCATVRASVYFHTVGTNGFGRSDTREALRAHFEIDAPSIVCSALYALSAEGTVKPALVEQAMKTLGVSAEKLDPMSA